MSVCNQFAMRGITRTILRQLISLLCGNCVPSSNFLQEGLFQGTTREFLHLYIDIHFRSVS